MCINAPDLFGQSDAIIDEVEVVVEPQSTLTRNTLAAFSMQYLVSNDFVFG